MAATNKNYYGLSLYGAQDFFAGAWTSEVTAPRKPINAIKVSYKGRYSARTINSSDKRILMTGFKDDSATGEFSIIYEGNILNQIDFWFDNPALVTLSVKVSKLTETGYEVIYEGATDDDAVFLNIMNVQELLWPIYAKIEITGTATEEGPVSFWTATYQATAIFAAVRLASNEEWSSFRFFPALSEGEIIGRSGTHNFIYVNVASKIFIDPAELYQVRLVLLSTDEFLSPEVSNLTIEADFEEPEPAEEKQGFLLYELRLKQTFGIADLDAVKVFSDDKVAPRNHIESENIFVTTMTDSYNDFTLWDIWSVPYSKAPTRLFLEPYWGYQYGDVEYDCFILDEFDLYNVPELDILKYDSFNLTACFSEYVPAHKEIGWSSYLSFQKANTVGTRSQPRIIIEAIQDEPFYNESVPVPSMDSTIQLNGPIYGRIEFNSTQIITRDKIVDFVRNYKNLEHLSMGKLPTPIRFRVSIGYNPNAITSPTLDRIDLFAEMKFLRERHLSAPGSDIQATTSHVLGVQYSYDYEHERWWVLPEEKYFLPLRKDESFLFGDISNTHQGQDPIYIESIGMSGPFPNYLREYLDLNPTDFVPFEIINRNKESSKYLSYRWEALAMAMFPDVLSITGSTENVLEVNNFDFFLEFGPAVVVKNSITKENPLTKKYISGILAFESQGISLPPTLEPDYVLFFADGRSPEEELEWTPHNVNMWEEWVVEASMNSAFAPDVRQFLNPSGYFEIWNTGPRPGEMSLWTSEQKIHTGSLNFDNKKESYVMTLSGNDLPVIDDYVLSFVETVKDIPYTVELVPGSVTIGDRIMDDSIMNDIIMSIPDADTSYIDKEFVVKILRNPDGGLTDIIYKKNLEEVFEIWTVGFYGDITYFEEYYDYTLVEVINDFGEKEFHVTWDEYRYIPYDNEFYFIRGVGKELNNLTVTTDSDFFYQDNIAQYFRSPLETHTGICTREEAYMSEPFDINSFEIPEEGVDTNSLKLVVFDNSEYINTRFVGNRVVADFEIKDMHESWKPLIKSGAYFSNRRQNFYYNNKVTREFNEDTVPIATETVIVDGAMYIQPGTENKLANTYFHRGEELYSILNNTIVTETENDLELYRLFYIRKNEHTELFATTDGSVKSGLVFYHTPSTHSVFYIEDGAAVFENNRNNRVALPIQRREIVPSANYDLRVVLYDTNIKCYVNNYMVFNIDQGSYLEGYAGTFGSTTNFDIQIKTVVGWDIVSYGDNPIYPVGSKLCFYNPYTAPAIRSYAAQEVNVFYDGISVLSTGDLEASFAGGPILPSPIIVQGDYEKETIKIYNMTDEKLFLEGPQLEEDRQTTYTAKSRNDTVLTMPYSLSTINLAFDIEVQDEDLFIFSVGNLEVYRENKKIVAKMGVDEETSIEDSPDRFYLEVIQTENEISFYLDAEHLFDMSATNLIISSPIYFGDYDLYKGRFALYNIRIGEYFYEFKDNLIFNDIDTVGVTANLPGTPISVTCNEIKYNRVFYIHDGNYSIRNRYEFIYNGNNIINLDYGHSDLLLIEAYIGARSLSIGATSNDRIRINGLRDEDVGNYVTVEYVPKDSYAVNYSEEDDTYIITLSNVYGTDVLVVYEDVIGPQRKIIKNIELNPFKATLNNGFIYLVEQMPPAVSIEYKVTPDILSPQFKDSCLIILDVKAEGGTYTDNCRLTINGQDINQAVYTQYGKIELLQDEDREDQITSGRYILKYTLTSSVEKDILKEAISVIDLIAKIGIEVPITIVR